jgi:hypothetical protein
LRINELGNAAQFQFIKSNYVKTAHDTAHDIRYIAEQVKKLILAIGREELSRKEIFEILNIKHKPTFRKDYLNPSRDAGFVELTIPDKPQSKLQKYRLTAKGKRLLAILIKTESLRLG